jgi:hypothetical protein
LNDAKQLAVAAGLRSYLANLGFLKRFQAGTKPLVLLHNQLAAGGQLAQVLHESLFLILEDDNLVFQLSDCGDTAGTQSLCCAAITLSPDRRSNIAQITDGYPSFQK